jgi:hypothetical protein
MSGIGENIKKLVFWLAVGEKAAESESYEMISERTFITSRSCNL